MGDLIDRVERLYPFFYSVTGRGNDEAADILLEELPSFHIHEFPSGSELNGWIVSPSWWVEKAEIRKSGQLIYDGMASPLGVITQSEPFGGTVDVEKLCRHLSFSDRDPDAVVYHCQQLYRPGTHTWGFCVPKRLYDSLDSGDYEVELVTNQQPGTMKVFDAVLPGRSPKTILFNAHNCHPYQANDDVSGMAVGIELMKRLAEIPDRRYTFRLLIAPELIGPMFWLGDLKTAG